MGPDSFPDDVWDIPERLFFPASLPSCCVAQSSASSSGSQSLRYNFFSQLQFLCEHCSGLSFLYCTFLDHPFSSFFLLHAQLTVPVPSLFPFSHSLPLFDSGNGVPDLLDEVRWEVESLVRMMGEDMAVYHKVSCPFPWLFPTFHLISPLFKSNLLHSDLICMCVHG